jgi:hypothetical protein
MHVTDDHHMLRCITQPDVLLYASRTPVSSCSLAETVFFPRRQVQPHDTLIVGWENEFPTNEEAFKRAYARTAQLEQWVFLGAPGTLAPLRGGWSQCPDK